MTIRAKVSASSGFTYTKPMYVTLTVAGFGRYFFNIAKFPGHCGASIMYNVSRDVNNKTTISEAEFFKQVTAWLLTNKRKELEFQRSRIITSDNDSGIISRMVSHCKKWKKSNVVVNGITSRKIAFYWLDRNK